MQHSDYGIDWQNSLVLYRCNDIVSRNLAKSALIQITQEQNYLVNTSPGLYIHDPVLLDMFYLYFKPIVTKFKS